MTIFQLLVVFILFSIKNKGYTLFSDSENIPEKVECNSELRLHTSHIHMYCTDIQRAICFVSLIIIKALFLYAMSDCLPSIYLHIHLCPVQITETTNGQSGGKKITNEMSKC